MTDELKKALQNAKNEEEVKLILQNNKEQLTDEELKMISGGEYRAVSPFIDELR